MATNNARRWFTAAALLLLVMLTIGLRLFPLIHGELLGPDAYYHASTLRRSVHEGRLSAENPLARCPYGVQYASPVGLYALPFILAQLIGFEMAMAASIVVLAVGTVLASVLLFRRMFGLDVALAAGFLLSVSFVFIQRSAALTYRGDLFGLLPLLLSLYFGVEMVEKDSWASAAVSGALLGSSAFFWNGFPLVVGIYWIAILSGIAAAWLSGKGKEGPFGALVALIACQLTFAVAQWIAPQSGVGGLFLRWGWIPSCILAVLLLAWGRCWKRGAGLRRLVRSKRVRLWPALLGSMLLVTVAVRLMLATLLSRTFFATISEFAVTSLWDIWTSLGFQALLLLPAAYAYFRGGRRHAVLTGWLLTSVVLAIMIRRFLFLVAVPVAAVVAIGIVSWVRARRTLILVTAIVVLASALHAMVFLAPDLLPMASSGFVREVQSLRDVLPERACVVTMWDTSSLVQWHMNRPTYTASVGGQDIDRIERTTRFFLGGGRFEPGENEAEQDTQYFALIREEDMPRLLRLNVLANVSDLALVSLQRVESRSAGNMTIHRLENDFYLALSDEGAQAAYIPPGGDAVAPVSLFILSEDGVYSKLENESAGCLYIGQGNFYLNQALCDSNLFRMLTQRPVPGSRAAVVRNGMALYEIVEMGRAPSAGAH